MSDNTNNNETVVAEAATPTKRSRGDIRAKIFAHRDVRKQVVDFFGEQIELRQPTLGDIISARENEDRQAAVIETLVKYAYIPGTDEKVFEESDGEAFKSMPFGADFLRINTALEELSEVNFLDKKSS